MRSNSSGSSLSAESLARYGALTDRQIDELTEAFETFDLDKDGEITAEELVQVLRKLGFHATDADIEAMMREADVDNSGSIDLDEFLRLHAAAAERLDHAQSSTILKTVFQIFDVDKNGVISPEELQQVLRSLSPEDDVTMEECQAMISQFDSNGDGVVDFPEFEKMMGGSDCLAAQQVSC